jgi:hypothetical protein
MLKKYTGMTATDLRKRFANNLLNESKKEILGIKPKWGGKTII